MSPISRKWSTETTRKFLLAYEQHPCLWDPKHQDYTHRNHRHRALQSLVESMLDVVPDFDIVYARAKIRSLRNAYILEHHKIINSIKNNDGTGTIYIPKLSWFPLADKFLTNIVEPKNEKYILDLPKLEYWEDSQEAESGTASHISDMEDNKADCFSSIESSATSSYYDNSTLMSRKPYANSNLRLQVTNVRYEDSKKNRNTKMSAEIIDPLETQQFSEDPLKIDSPQSDLDEFELFGRTVGAHLRRMPLHVALDSQCKVLNYLVGRRLGRESSL